MNPTLLNRREKQREKQPKKQQAFGGQIQAFIQIFRRVQTKLYFNEFGLQSPIHNDIQQPIGFKGFKVESLSKRRLMPVLLLGLGLLSATSTFAEHALSQYGKPKYSSDFSHFDYVNPQAPQGGTLTLPNPDRRTSFDKFNPFTLRGVSAPGVAGLMFESLGIGSADEVSTVYGLLAEDIALAKDKMSVTFKLRAEAKFSDGTPVLASDVKYSFDTLMSKLSNPQFKTIYADITRAVVISDRVIRFDFKDRNGEAPILVATMPIFSKSWGKQADGSMKAFDKITFEEPIASGPYLIESHQSGKSIIFKKNPNYWGKHLNVRRGAFNFDRVVYKLYSDDTVRLEALKAGEFDALVEYRAKLWAKSYVGPKFNDGTLIKKDFQQQNGAGMQGFAMNTRRAIFSDPRVRKALTLALDFEWLNRQIFFNQYRRLDSYFANSDLGASYVPNSTPSAQELKVLSALDKKYPGQIPKEVFGPMLSPVSTQEPQTLRNNLRQARELLAQAGWTYRDGALRDKAGKPFTFEIVEDSPFLLRIITAYIRNLEKLGIKAEVRTSDYALYQKRLEGYDFDMTTIRFPDTQSPGNELWDRFGSAAALEKGSDNLIGVRSPVVDALIGEIVKAEKREQLVVGTRALDRVLSHSYYVVPHWYNPTHRIAYRKEMGYPKPPLYYTAESWILSTWWRQAQQKDLGR
jgi:microcin C transport system substrate-binding protein